MSLDIARASENLRDLERSEPAPAIDRSGDLTKQSASRERVDQWAWRFSTGKKVRRTSPLRRTVLERLTFSRPVSSGLTNRGRDGYEITTALSVRLFEALGLCSPRFLSSRLDEGTLRLSFEGKKVHWHRRSSAHRLRSTRRNRSSTIFSRSSPW